MHWIQYLSTNDLELAMLTNIIFVQNKRDTQKSFMKHFPIFHLHISLIQIHIGKCYVNSTTPLWSKILEIESGGYGGSEGLEDASN